MNSAAIRLRTLLMPETKYQLLGTGLMLLSSITLFNVITWSPLFFFPHTPSIVMAGCCFLIGAILSHRACLFLENLGLNFYVMGWAFVIHGLCVANTYLEMYLTSVVGVYIVFLGVLLYFLRRENPTRVIVENHIFLGTTLLAVGAILFLFSFFEIEINIFYLVRVGRIPAFWVHKAFATILAGFGILVIALFMHLMTVYT